jgi:hypothetical protein
MVRAAKETMSRLALPVLRPALLNVHSLVPLTPRSIYLLERARYSFLWSFPRFPPIA